MKQRLEALIQEMRASGIYYQEAKQEFDKRWVLAVLNANHGNQFRAAIELGVHRNTLGRAMDRMDLRRDPKDRRFWIDPIELAKRQAPRVARIA